LAEQLAAPGVERRSAGEPRLAVLSFVQAPLTTTPESK